MHYITVTAIDDYSPAQVQTAAQGIYLPQTANRPTNSSNIAYETRSGSNSRVWVVNQDNDSVSAFDVVNNSKVAEINVGTAPRTLAIAPDGRLWVTNKGSATISIIDTNSLSVAQTISLPFASAPFGVAFAPTGGFAFVALEATGRVLKLNSSTGAQVGSVDVGPNPRHLSVSSDGATVLVSRFVTPPLPGENTANVQTARASVARWYALSASSMTILGTIVLQHSNAADLENQGSGVPNYLGAATISPDGTDAWVPSKQDNIRRGTLRNGINLNFQSTVRAISSRIDLSTSQEDFASRLDLDNSSVASAVAFDKYGIYMFVALETSREVVVVDVHGGWQMFRINVGLAPQGLTVSPDGLRLYVNNFMDRKVGVFDLARLVNFGETNVSLIANLPAVASEKLSATVLKGKQLFYDAIDTRLARDKYLSCATCHNDGAGDGRVWDLTGMGEGLRNTINLRGRAGTNGQGFAHWSSNFDEIQDFEGQIRNLSGGTGLMSNTDFNTGTRSQPLGDAKAGVSADLDALAAYVTSLNTFASSPNRNSDGTLTADALAGKQIFFDSNCGQCHRGSAFTDSGAANLHNVGTIKPSSGTRLGGPLTGIDTPTLRDVWATAPYLHDGSAATLGDAVRAHSGVSISDSDLTKLTAYLAQIGSDETAAPRPNDPPTISNPGSQSSGTGVAVNLAISASDPNGDSLRFSAGGLPGGLSINQYTGVITGTPAAPGTFNATVTVNDGDLSASTGFTWGIGDTNPPSAPATLTANAVSSTQINLSWSAATDDVGVTGYQIERCAGAGCTFAPLITVTTTSYNNTGLTASTNYSYRVRATDGAGNLGAYSSPASATTQAPPDTSAPTAPAGLAATATSGTQINLSWTASTDNVAVTGYQIERCSGAGCSNFASVGTSATTTFSNTGLTASTSYSYRVRATDAASNLSGYSNTATATTPSGAIAGLVAAYGFNEGTGTTVTDASGNTNTGAISGATWITTGKNGGALLFNGTNARVSIPSSTSLNPTSAITLEAWVYPTAAQSGWRTIIQHEVDAYFLHASANGALSPAGGGTIGGSTVFAETGTALAINTWSHLAMTFGANTIRLYINGTQVATASRTGTIETNSNPVSIGSNSTYGEYFQGRIDDVRIYNRALSVAEIQADMATQVGDPPAPDTSAPTVPGTLTATAASATQINLSWTASTDNLGVTGYELERCSGAGCSIFTTLTTVTTTTYNNTGLTAATSYSYHVRAVDAAGNRSAFSNVASATTPTAPDTSAPTVPPGLTATAASSTQINLTWTASTDDVGVTGYRLERCQGAGCTTWAQIATPTTTSYPDSALAASTAYRYRVRAVDAAANLSGYSSIATATTLAGPDTTPPAVTITTPTGNTTFSTTTTPLNIGGTASDAVGVTQVTWTNDRGGSGTATGTTAWSVTGIVLQSGANVLTVTARDAAGNTNIDTLTVTFTPPVPDTTPPLAPATLTATPSSGQINLSWAAATDNIAVTGYSIERCQGGGCTTFAQIGTTTTATTYSNTGLTASTSYSYRVRANDAAGNLSPYSPTATASTPSAAGPVAAYGFNEGTGTTVTDASGNTNTGAISGATWITTGKNGGALLFNGTNARVSIPSSTSLNPTSAITLEAWVYPTAAQSGWRTIIQHEVDAYFMHASANGALAPAGGGTINGSTVWAETGTALPINTWSHLAMTFGANTIRLYVNGTQVATASRTGTIETNSNPVSIGSNSTYGEYFLGRIDDVRIYNRALSVAEIQADMNTPVAP